MDWLTMGLPLFDMVTVSHKKGATIRHGELDRTVCEDLLGYIAADSGLLSSPQQERVQQAPIHTAQERLSWK